MMIIKLDNGNYLFNDYGKYSSGLSFILPSEDTEIFKSVETEQYNLPDGDLSEVKGRFFTSKKGTKCFDVKEDGPDVLIRDSWGGSFNKYRGDTLSLLPNQKYFNRASSNGGGNGYDYVVVPIHTKYTISIDDI
jgi:hypothetical protein